MDEQEESSEHNVKQETQPTHRIALRQHAVVAAIVTVISVIIVALFLFRTTPDSKQVKSAEPQQQGKQSLSSESPAVQVPGLAPIELGAPTNTIELGDATYKTVDLPSSITDPVVWKTPDQAAKELANRSSLTLDKTKLEIVGPAATISVNTLTFKNGAQIITNGQHLHMQALKIISDDGSIVSFSPERMKLNAAGASGYDAGSLRIELFEKDGWPHKIQIRLEGQNGVDGGKGAKGLPGQPGKRGNDAVSGLFDCRRGGENGASGMPGGFGEKGYPGGNGGKGGNIEILVRSQKLRKQIEKLVLDRMISIEPGQGGNGGEGGEGGPGGQGGEGGSGSGFCQGGKPGPSGLVGPSGQSGDPGSDGSPGVFKISVTK